MTETPSLRLGANIARYRKLAGLSAQALADTAGSGLTRSQIADLENGRKKDLSVLQLLSVARVLNVPPVALLSDLYDPSAEVGIDLPPRKLLRKDPETGEIISYTSGVADQHEFRLWIAGVRVPSLPPIADPAPRAAYVALREQDAYQRQAKDWLNAIEDLKDFQRQEERADDADDENWNRGADYAGSLVGRVVAETALMRDAIARLQEAGIRVPTAAKFVSAGLAEVGVPESMVDSFQDSPPDNHGWWGPSGNDQ